MQSTKHESLLRERNEGLDILADGATNASEINRRRVSLMDVDYTCNQGTLNSNIQFKF